MNNEQKEIRQKLISAIIESSSDEFETKKDFIILAMKTENELIDDVLNLLDYYATLANEYKSKDETTFY